MKDKVIKKQKPLPPIEKDEEPFEIPDSWEWVRLGEIGIIKSGGTPKTKIEEYWNNGDIPWITPADMGRQTSKKYLVTFAKYITATGLEKSSAQLIEKGSIIYSSRAPIGHINIVPFSYTTNQGCKSITPIIVIASFLYYILQSLKEDIIRQGSGTTFKEISLTVFSNIKLPLPPIQEQQRIADTIEELFAELDKIDKAQEKYDSAANKLREKVLDTAMRGKLVPQDPNDEPANELLKRIENEKQHLIKEKVIKKQRPLPPISKDEVPFEIPESWEWVRLGKVCRFIDYRGKTPKKINHGIRLLTAKNIKKGFLSLEPEEFISVDEHMERNTRGNVQKDSILFTTEAPLGNVAINPFDNVAIAQRTIAIDSYNKMTNYFLFYELLSPMIQISIKKTATGSTVKGIKAANLRNILILLPPLSEQQRIVSKIEEIFPLLKV